MTGYHSRFILAALLTLFSAEFSAKFLYASSQTIRIGNSAEPKSLDPDFATGAPEVHILDNLFEGLVTFDTESLTLKPGVAESWEISADQKVFRFNLRKNATWSDGTPITAKDFHWSWLHRLDPKTGSDIAYQLYNIKNAEPYNKGKIKDSEQVGIKIINPYILEVTLENPQPKFLYLTGFLISYPKPRHVFEKYGDKWTHEQHLVSNGPFRLTKWQLNRSIELEKNSKYWDHANVLPNKLIFYPIENHDTEEKTFLSGGLDITSSVPQLKLTAFFKNPNKYKDYPIQTTPLLGTYFYKLNCNKKPLNDKRVRQALNLAIDRKLLVKSLALGYEPAYRITPEIVKDYYYKSSLQSMESDDAIKKAKRLLSEAGFPDGKNFPELEILYNTSENHKKIALAVQNMLKKNLGISVKLYNQEWKVYLDSIKNQNYALVRSGWIGTYLGPEDFVGMFETGIENNNTSWSNTRFDALLKEAEKVGELGKKNALYMQAEEILMDELPFIPLFFYTNSQLVSPKMKFVDYDNKQKAWHGNYFYRNMYKRVLITN